MDDCLTLRFSLSVSELCAILDDKECLSGIFGDGARLGLAERDPVRLSFLTPWFADCGTVSRVDWIDGDGVQPTADTYSVASRNPRANLIALTNEGRLSLQIHIASLTPTSCRLRITHVPRTSKVERHRLVSEWNRALSKLETTIRRAQERRRKARTAIVVFHGIGEQSPGQFLREFVSSVFGESSDKVYIKPDVLSPLYEVRRATVSSASSSIGAVDVYEVYWAHLVKETTLAQVLTWIGALLVSSKQRIPATLYSSVVLLRWAILALAAATVGIWHWHGSLEAVTGLSVLAGLARYLLFPWLKNTYLIGYAGDAARYLEPRPENIEIRQSIREVGVELLDKICSSTRYQRAIVYGHSLGSVIAYDVLTFAWARRSCDGNIRTRCTNKRLTELEDLLNPDKPGVASPVVEEVQRRQFRAWREYRSNGFTWPVTDFISAGSPLAHARWLLRFNHSTDFDALAAERTYPTAPPTTELARSPRTDPSTGENKPRRVFTYTHSFTVGARKGLSVKVPNHGAPFSLVRWTNLYFPHGRFLQGDPVAGPLHPQLGSWVRDIALERTRRFAHSMYTRADGDAHAVREALNLEDRRSLVDLIRDEEV